MSVNVATDESGEVTIWSWNDWRRQSNGPLSARTLPSLDPEPHSVCIHSEKVVPAGREASAGLAHEIEREDGAT